jgi:hypothetical protein
MDFLSAKRFLQFFSCSYIVISCYKTCICNTPRQLFLFCYWVFFKLPKFYFEAVFFFFLSKNVVGKDRVFVSDVLLLYDNAGKIRIITDSGFDKNPYQNP